MINFRWVILSCLIYCNSSALAGQDNIRFPQRIVSLAPHLTELVFDLGRGKDIVATVDFSDYPALALDIPRIGSATRLDYEQLLRYRPELVLVWQNSSSSALIDKLQQLKLPYLALDTSSLQAIARAMQQLAHAIGEDSKGKIWQDKFTSEIATLTKENQAKAKVSVFYQIWQNPLMTLGGADIFNEIVQLCSGENIFAKLNYPAAKINIEAVLQANPQVIIVSGMAKAEPEWLAAWQQWKNLRAVQENNLFSFPPDLLQRQSQRILQGARMLCNKLDVARSKKK